MPKAKYTGPITLGEVVDAAPVKKDTGIDLSEFRSLLQRSWEKKQGGNATPAFAVTVPSIQSRIVQTRFRTAAKEMGLGVAIDVVEADSDKGRQAGVPAGHVRLVIESRKKKAPKGSSNGSTASPAPSAGNPPIQPQKATAGLPKPAGRK